MIIRLAFLLLLSTGSIIQVLASDIAITPFIREVPIKENGEPLIDLRDQTIIAYDESMLLKNPDCTQVRETIYKKICETQELLPYGLRFQLLVGLRSLRVQEQLFAKQYAKLKEQMPSMDEKELFLETSKFVAPVKTWENQINVPPHSTGAAIDIILINLEGIPVDMGVDLDDPLQNEKAMRTNSDSISVDARKNRDIMAKALSAADFVNYSGEFWHWSYGDRRWAYMKHAEHAIYGPMIK